MISSSAQGAVTIRTPRPYHQKMTVEVTRKPSNDTIAASTPVDFFTPKIQQQKNGGSSAPEDKSQAGFEELFARLMVNLGAQNAVANPRTSQDNTSVSQNEGVSAIPPNESSKSTDQGAAAQENDLLSAAADQPTMRSAKDDFMEYMNQTDAEKLRQELTGITKEKYDQMSPEEKLAVDQKVQELLKKKQEIAEVTLKAKIAMAKTQDSQVV